MTTDSSKPQLAVQLYSLRETGDDIVAMVPKLAAMGYAGVELAGLGGLAPSAIAKALDDNGMVASSAHVGLGDAGLDESELDAVQGVGIDSVVVAFLPPADFASPETVAVVADRLNRAAEQAAPRGLTVGYHNHFWEMKKGDDGATPMHKVLFDQLSPSVVAELDIYWTQVGGIDPAWLVAQLGDKARFLHVKDGPADDRAAPMVAVGTGAVDIPAVLKAAPAAHWHIVELDRCATDMYEAVEQSARYLLDLGLTAGRAL